MPFIGNKPSAVPLTSADIADGIITSAKIVDGTIATADLNTGLTVNLGAGAVGTPTLTTSGDTNTGIFFPAADTIAFTEGGTEAMRISSSGNVLIGTTANNAGKLNVDGSIYLYSQTTGAGTSTLKYNHTVTGLVTYDTSSRLVKENIENSPYGLNEILQLQSRKYFRIDDQQNEIGLIADEVVNILPELVSIGAKKSITRNEEDVELIPVGVNYDKLTSVLVKAIQELSAKNESLEARLTALENN